MRLRQTYILCAALALSLLSCRPAWSKADPNSPLSPEVQSTLMRASRGVKGGSKSAKAVQTFESSLQDAGSIDQCLAIASYTEACGVSLMSVRRECLKKALSLCQAKEDYVEIAHACRKYECYDVEREAMDAVLKTANTADELYDLAQRAHKMAARDLVQQALIKAYALCKSVPDALRFAREANLVGADDLSRRAVKDLIDDENNTHGLMVLLDQIEPFNLKDLDRYLLKKSLDVSSKFEDYVEIAEASRRFNEPDIRTVAIYRAKKKKILQQFDAEKAKKLQESQNQAPAVENKSGF